MSAPAVVIDGDRLRVEFSEYGLEAYGLFLRTKLLPETSVSFDWRRDTYVVTAPARFADRLGMDLVVPPRVALPLAEHLRDYQRWALGMALDAKRFALWADTGLGKTAMFLEFARQVLAMTDGRVLILSPLAVIPQTVAEAERWYGDALPVRILQTRDDLVAWCDAGEPGVAICNYDKLIPGEVREFRGLAGLICDEASILRTGGGKIKWNLIHSGKGVEFKLTCTATPAPNEAMEYASQAGFLEKMRSEGEILWTYFQRDKHGEWTVKPHARTAFYQFMSTWSLYLRDPAAWGFEDVLAQLPAPEIVEERIALTDEQREAMTAVQVNAGTGFITDDRVSVTVRQKLSQIARGFVYDKTATGKKFTRSIPSNKSDIVADWICDQALIEGQRVLVWTTFDAEADVLLAATWPSGVAISALDGGMSPEERLEMLEQFRDGRLDVLISKPQLIGYGLNLQFVTAMVFYGFDDSFERMYQAIRRAVRVGQTKKVLVYVPYVPELEGMVFTNLREKEARFMDDVAAMEVAYREVLVVADGVGAAA